MPGSRGSWRRSSFQFIVLAPVPLDLHLKELAEHLAPCTRAILGVGPVAESTLVATVSVALDLPQVHVGATCSNAGHEAQGRKGGPLLPKAAPFALLLCQIRNHAGGRKSRAAIPCNRSMHMWRPATTHPPCTAEYDSVSPFHGAVSARASKGGTERLPTEP